MAANDRHPMEEVVDRRDLLAPKTTGVVVYADKPTYPVITTSPTFSQMVTAIRPEEWLGVAAWTVGGAALGYYMGFRQQFTRLPMYFTSFMFGKSSFLWYADLGQFRLIGRAENAREVELFREQAAGLTRELGQRREF